MAKRATTHKSSDNLERCPLCDRLVPPRNMEMWCDTTTLNEPYAKPVLVCKDVRGCLNVGRGLLPF
jgi:hypothetical protein